MFTFFCYLCFEWHLWCFQRIGIVHFQGFVRKALAQLPPHNGGSVHQVIRATIPEIIAEISNIATCFVGIIDKDYFSCFLDRVVMISLSVEPKVDLLLNLLLLILKQLASRDEAFSSRLRQWRRIPSRLVSPTKWNRSLKSAGFPFGWILIYIREW